MEGRVLTDQVSVLLLDLFEAASHFYLLDPQILDQFSTSGDRSILLLKDLL